MSGYKIGCPLVLDTFHQYGLPLYMTCDISAIDVYVSTTTNNKHALSPMIHLLDKYVDSKYLKPLEYINIDSHNNISIPNRHLASYHLAALLHLVYLNEKNFITEIDVSTLIDEICSSDTNNFIPGIVKSLIKGGVNLSNIGYHERIFLGEGLFIQFELGSKPPNNMPHLDAETAGLVVSYLLKGQSEDFTTVMDNWFKKYNTIGLYDQLYERPINFTQLGQVSKNYIESDSVTAKINHDGISKY